MKRSVLVSFALSIVFIFAFCGVAFSGGAEPCPGCCENPPAPTSGPFLYGTFTVAQDKSAASQFPGQAGYDVQILLQYRHEKHLFSFFVLALVDLCAMKSSNPDPNSLGLKEMFAGKPCSLEVGVPFGFDSAQYTPAISDLHILIKDFCETPDEMIHGMITIRLVPATPPKPPKPKPPHWP